MLGEGTELVSLLLHTEAYTGISLWGRRSSTSQAPGSQHADHE